MSEDSSRTISVEGIPGAWLIFELFPIGSLSGHSGQCCVAQEPRLAGIPGNFPDLF